MLARDSDCLGIAKPRVGGFCRGTACVGAAAPRNPLCLQQNSAPEDGGCIGYACFGQAANTAAGYLITQEGWSEDSSQALLLHGLIGAAEGAISGGGSAGATAAGAIGAVAGTAITPVLIKYLLENGIDPSGTEGHLLLTLASSAIGAGAGALTGGGNVAIDAETGGSTAANSTLYNATNPNDIAREEQCLEGGCAIPGEGGGGGGDVGGPSSEGNDGSLPSTGSATDGSGDVTAGAEGTGSALVNPTIVDELVSSGAKITPQNVVATGTTPSGQNVWLETGNSSAGLEHIVEGHANDFANIGVSVQQIPQVVMDAVTEGNIVGYQGSGTGRPIYQTTVNGQVQNIAVTIGSNGFIVGANPAGRVP